jgi:hypothetical protein
MTSRRSGCLLAVLTALFLGGQAWAILWGLTALFCPIVALAITAGGTLAAAAGGACMGWKAGRHEVLKRWADLREVAHVRKELGLDYERNLPEWQMRRFFPLPLFDSPVSRKFGHVMSSTAGEGRVLLFGYEPTISRGPVILFPDVGLPEFELHPRKWWDFQGKGLRFDPEELPDEAGQELMRSFTGSYLVEALEEEEVRQLFSMEKVAFLAGHPGWEVQSYAGHLAMYKGRKKVPLQKRPALFREALALARLFHPPLGTDDGPWARRAGPSAGQIQTKPSRFGNSPHPGPGPASDGRFVNSE